MALTAVCSANTVSDTQTLSDTKTSSNTRTFDLSRAITELPPLPDVQSDDGWELALEKDGVRILKRDWPESSFVAVKTEQVIRSSLSNIVANFLDVSTFTEWVTDLKHAEELKGFNDRSERVVYMRMGLPWPLEDRDAVIGQRLSQDSKSLVVHIREWNEGTNIPEHDGITRIPKANSEVYLIPLDDGSVKMIWQGHNEPGGIVPAFLANWMIESVFYESSLNMRERFESPDYFKSQPGIIDP